MGHAAFERAQEDKEAHKEWLKEEEKLWAAMASPVDINFTKSTRKCLFNVSHTK